MTKDYTLIVTLLMTFIGAEISEVSTSPAGDSVTRKYLMYKCPNPGFLKPVVRFLDNTGFSSPYRHQLSCPARGKYSSEQEATLYLLFQETRERATRSGGKIRSHLRVSTSTEYEKACHSYLKLVLSRSMPLTLLELHDFRSISLFNEVIRCRRLVVIIFKLIKLLEHLVTLELQDTKGALIYDDWLCNNMDYNLAIASY